MKKKLILNIISMILSYPLKSLAFKNLIKRELVTNNNIIKKNGLSRVTFMNYPKKISEYNFTSDIQYVNNDLINAIQNGDKENINLLLDNGADINATDTNGNTALMIALLEDNDIETISLLLDRGTDVNTKNNDGGTALSAAVLGDNRAAIPLLIERGVEVNAKNNDGKTALMEAVTYSDIETVKLLIQNGADLNIQDNEGWTALILIMIWEHMPFFGDTWGDGRTEMARFLIENGADISIKDNTGQTALMHATRDKYEDIIKIITDKKDEILENKYGIFDINNSASNLTNETQIEHHNNDINQDNCSSRSP